MLSYYLYAMIKKLLLFYTILKINKIYTYKY